MDIYFLGKVAPPGHFLNQYSQTFGLFTSLSEPDILIL